MEMTNNPNEAFISKEAISVSEGKGEVEVEAIGILDLIEEQKLLDAQILIRRENIKKLMIKSGLKKILFFTGDSITICEKKQIKVNKKKAEEYLDSIGEKEAFMKLDETKIKKVYYNPESNTSYDFILVDPPKLELRIVPAK